MVALLMTDPPPANPTTKDSDVKNTIQCIQTQKEPIEGQHKSQLTFLNINA